MMNHTIKNKKGFTLVEVIAVVAVLAIISGLVIVGISSYVKKGKQEYNEKIVSTFKLASNNYIKDNPTVVPKLNQEESSSKVIYYDDLIANNYLSSAIKDADNGDCSSSFTIIEYNSSTNDIVNHTCFVCDNYKPENDEYCNIYINNGGKDNNNDNECNNEKSITINEEFITKVTLDFKDEKKVLFNYESTKDDINAIWLCPNEVDKCIKGKYNSNFNSKEVFFDVSSVTDTTFTNIKFYDSCNVEYNVNLIDDIIIDKTQPVISNNLKEEYIISPEENNGVLKTIDFSFYASDSNLISKGFVVDEGSTESVDLDKSDYQINLGAGTHKVKFFASDINKNEIFEEVVVKVFNEIIYFDDNKIELKTVNKSFDKSIEIDTFNVSDNYKFDYWTDDNNNEYKANSNYSSNKSINLYPHISLKYINVNVEFFGNGGTPSFSSKKVLFNKEYGELPTITRENYKFLGWYTAKTDGDMIDSTTIVTNASTHTLYALWKSTSADTYNVSYKKGICYSIDKSTDTKIKEIALKLPTKASASVKEKTGTTFIGWSLTKPSSSTSTVSYKGGGSYKTDKAVTLYAVCRPNKLTIHYSNGLKNENTSLSSKYSLKLGSSYYYISKDDVFYSSELEYGTTYSNGIVNASTFGLKRNDYYFSGWYTKPNGDGVNIPQDPTGNCLNATVNNKTCNYDEAVEINSNIESSDSKTNLYAYWKPVVSIEIGSCPDEGVCSDGLTPKDNSAIGFVKFKFPTKAKISDFDYYYTNSNNKRVGNIVDGIWYTKSSNGIIGSYSVAKNSNSEFNNIICYFRGYNGSYKLGSLNLKFTIDGVSYTYTLKSDNVLSKFVTTSGNVTKGNGYIKFK